MTGSLLAAKLARVEALASLSAMTQSLDGCGKARLAGSQVRDKHLQVTDWCN